MDFIKQLRTHIKTQITNLEAQNANFDDIPEEQINNLSSCERAVYQLHEALWWAEHATSDRRTRSNRNARWCLANAVRLDDRIEAFVLTN
jgi:hypothetical protein